ncbi:MAG: TatD family hydrolase [Holosporales bacterium]|nr:TatD family hydrolase [Holosporales bacterium]
MKGLVDSHAHLCYEEIFNSLEAKLRLAKLAGVDYIMTVGTDFKTMFQNVEVAEQRSNVFSSVGIHPLHFKDGHDVSEIKKLAHHKKVVAIGEIGLDYHYADEIPKNDQICLFREMLAIAESINLPCIFHARECFRDIFDIIMDYKLAPSVFHCFTGTIDEAKKILDLGHYISFSGVITFKNSNELRQVAEYVPNDKVLVETDCPYLAPVPYRGKTNEPAFVSLVAECLAKIKNVSIDQIAETTSANFFKLFPKSDLALQYLTK